MKKDQNYVGNFIIVCIAGAVQKTCYQISTAIC